MGFRMCPQLGSPHCRETPVSRTAVRLIWFSSLYMKKRELVIYSYIYIYIYLYICIYSYMCIYISIFCSASIIIKYPASIYWYIYMYVYIYWEKLCNRNYTLRGPSKLTHFNGYFDKDRELFSSKYLWKCGILLGPQWLALKCRFCWIIFVSVC